jgi:polysaccharide export outer membrane protein
MTVASRLACLVALLLLAACSAAEWPGGPRGPVVTSVPAPPRPAIAKVANSATAGGPEKDGAMTYVIGPGDNLYVYVYDSPQLSMDVPVSPEGRISSQLFV